MGERTLAAGCSGIWADDGNHRMSAKSAAGKGKISGIS